MKLYTYFVDESIEQFHIVKAVYTYEAAGKNQLSFDEGDRIALIGNRANGWQFGENLQTKMLGWFPETYIEYETNGKTSKHYDHTPKSTLKRTQIPEAVSPSRMFGDTLMFRNTKYVSINNCHFKYNFYKFTF